MACVDENRLVPTKILSFLLKFTTEKFKSTGKAAEKKDVMSKIYKFFTESYIHDVYVAHDQGARGSQPKKLRSRTSCRLNVKVTTTVLQT